MQWTIEANGPHGEDDEDRDHRPTDWNIHFFDFLGVLAVNLSNEQLVSMFLEPMSRFTTRSAHFCADLIAPRWRPTPAIRKTRRLFAASLPIGYDVDGASSA
jgi:hypothetical protein